VKLVGNALVHTSDEEMKRVVHLLDLAYTLAKEEIAFLKFPSLAEEQKRAGAKHTSPSMMQRVHHCLVVHKKHINSDCVTSLLHFRCYFGVDILSVKCSYYCFIKTGHMT